MKITITDARKISAIQEAFSEKFPYLKLVFFSKPHKAEGSSSKKLVKHNSKNLGECHTLQTSGDLLNPNMTVADLEQEFGDVYGLGVQVFRKSGTVWLETTLTNSWTLEGQNKQGEELSKLHQ